MGPTKESTKTRFDRWIRKPWESLSPRRSKDAPKTDNIVSATITSSSVPPSPANRGSTVDDINCGQILGKDLQPVVYEVVTGQFILGYLCDVDWERKRVLVDFDCYDHPPLWLPGAQVQRHRAVREWDLGIKRPFEAALRLASDQPYVFYPARIISPVDDSAGPICVEVTPPGGDVPIRKFVHPLQLRIVWKYPRSSYAAEYDSVVGCCRQLHQQTAPLEFGQNVEDIDLQWLLQAVNEIPWINVVRIWLDTQSVHFVYTKKGKENLNETVLKILVQNSRCHVTAPEKLLDLSNTDAVRDGSLVKLPYELLKRIVLSIEDIHSVVSAQKVCKSWHDILRRDINQHAAVAIDLTNLLPDSSSSKERNYNRTQLINILDTTVTTATVGLLLMNGNLSMELAKYIVGFLSIKVPCLPAIFLRNILCSYPVAQKYEQQRLEWANLSQLMLACRELHLQNVIVPALFGSIAGLWTVPAETRLDIDAVVDKLVLHSTLTEDDRMEHFLKALDASCPAFTACDRKTIDNAYRATLSRAEFPPRNTLLMIQLLNRAITGQKQPPLSRLAAHAFRYSYPTEATSSSSVPGCRFLSCPTPSDPRDTEEILRH
ncbi:uncharacterized protein LOC129598946 [Paramacrobiotus metropolitanus]|uniref:uncharacterized protein LOC129598946 n=1 Tax=Paramacrobiotus metropolitanus TaxID=2943436 RepID=UPI002446567D|nr:uncharacterized protein LOC129598946 [Paramacrobiotus metropolitanus]